MFIEIFIKLQIITYNDILSIKKNNRKHFSEE